MQIVVCGMHIAQFSNKNCICRFLKCVKVMQVYLSTVRAVQATGTCRLHKHCVYLLVLVPNDMTYCKVSTLSTLYPLHWKRPFLWHGSMRNCTTKTYQNFNSSIGTTVSVNMMS